MKTARHKTDEEFELAWQERMRGLETQALRMIIGIAAGELVKFKGVNACDLIEYIRAALQRAFPEDFPPDA